MIQINYDGKSYRPAIICDICKEPIADVSLAIARGNNSLDSPGVADAIHVHKGDCDGKATEIFGASGSDELGHHIVRIAVNCGLTPEGFRATLEQLNELN